MIAGSAAVQMPRAPVFSPVLADEAPWGNILVHQPDAAEALELQRLLRTAGYRMIGPAGTAADAERFLTRNAVDCAIIDAPSGLAVGALLDDRAIPFVALSSDASDALAWHCEGRPVVIRPYRPAEMLRAIHQAMRRRDRAVGEKVRRLPS
jgi:DNA-binding response OmpR family regulator